MFAKPKPGAALAQLNGPVIETPRLKLRQWCHADIAPYTAMLADPGTARFITVDGKPVTDEMTGWRHTVVMAGHWAIHGAGMFAIEEKHSGTFVGRAGPWFPPVAGFRNRLGRRQGSARQGLCDGSGPRGDRLGVREFRDRAGDPLHRS